LGALTEAGNESGIQREKARFFFPLFFQHVAKARWKEKHDGAIILERMFLVNGYIISRPVELDCFECEKGEKIPDESFIGNSVFKRRRIHPFSQI
jgi:hypothetical protein